MVLLTHTLPSPALRLAREVGATLALVLAMVAGLAWPLYFLL